LQIVKLPPNRSLESSPSWSFLLGDIEKMCTRLAAVITRAMRAITVGLLAEVVIHSLCEVVWLFWTAPIVNL
jgi:hypothetical protein